MAVEIRFSLAHPKEAKKPKTEKEGEDAEGTVEGEEAPVAKAEAKSKRDAVKGSQTHCRAVVPSSLNLTHGPEAHSSRRDIPTSVQKIKEVCRQVRHFSLVIAGELVLTSPGSSYACPASFRQPGPE